MIRTVRAAGASLAREQALLQQLARSEARVAELTEEVAALAGQVARGNERLDELLAIAQRKHRPPAKKAPEPKPLADLTREQKERFENRPRPPPRPPKSKKPMSSAKPTGRKPLPEHLEAEEHVLAPERCACGSGDLELVDEVVEIKLHVVKEHQRRRVVKRKTGCCCECGTRTTARSLPAPSPRSKATCEWLAWFVHLHCVLLVPLDRIRRDLASRGVVLAMSYLVSQSALVTRASQIRHSSVHYVR